MATEDDEKERLRQLELFKAAVEPELQEVGRRLDSIRAMAKGTERDVRDSKEAFAARELQNALERGRALEERDAKRRARAWSFVKAIAIALIGAIAEWALTRK